MRTWRSGFAEAFYNRLLFIFEDELLKAVATMPAADRSAYDADIAEFARLRQLSHRYEFTKDAAGNVIGKLVSEQKAIDAPNS